MKKFSFPFLIVLFFLSVLSSSVCAQDEEAEHDALRKIRDVYQEAVNTNQLEMLRPYLAPGFSVVTFTDTEFDDFEKFKTQWQTTRKKMLKGGSYEVKLNPVRSVIMDDIALAKGNAENILIDGDGNEFNFTSHWTALLKKTDGEWKILRGHNSLQPFKNPVTEHAVKKILIKYSGLAFIAGLLIGAGVMRFAYRKK